MHYTELICFEPFMPLRLETHPAAVPSTVYLLSIL